MNIIHRGQRVDSNLWVYGNYVPVNGSKPLIVTDVCLEDNGTVTFDDYYHVEPETVGAFTGMKDKFNNDIYEGDIVSFKRNALGWVTERVGDVRYYDKLPIFYIMATTGDAWDWVECYDIEVIGNVHDNPELLEVQE